MNFYKQNQLKKIFIDFVLPQLRNEKSLAVYEGIGVTSTQIESVIKEFENEQRAKAEQKFKTKYVNKLKAEQNNPTEEKLENWMKSLKKNAPWQYWHVAQLANEYNEKNNIDKRYEYLHKFLTYLYKNLILKVIGALFVIFFIWARFIYKRLPKDIPFNLSMIGLLILIIICLIHLFIIYKMFKPSLSPYWKKSLYPLAKGLLHPLVQFSLYLLSYNITRQIIKILLNSLYKLFKVHLANSDYIYNFLTIRPKIIFAICFIIDCLYFKQLYLIYTCVIMMTFPLIVQYLMYISDIIKAYDTDLLDEHFIIEITSEDIVYAKTDYDEEGFLKPGNATHFTEPSDLDSDSLDDSNKYKYLKTLKFVKYQTVTLYCDDSPYEYKILFQDERKDVIYLEDPLRPKDLNKEMCNDLLLFHINISLLKECIEGAYERHKHNYFKLKILLIIIPFICWLYILTISLQTFHLSDFEALFLQTFQDNVQPFSDTPINDT